MVMEARSDSIGENHLEPTPSARQEIYPSNDDSTLLEENKMQSNAVPRNSGFLPKTAADSSGKFSAAGFANWAKGRINAISSDNSSGEVGKNPFNLLSNSFNRRSASKIPVVETPLESPSASSQEGPIGTFAKGILDSSKNAMKAVQTKARHLVSQNKIRYQEGGFDLDLAYITDNIIAMGFPAGDLSSGLLGYVEGFYRNHMEEVIKFFETHHKEKYKVYNLCSERLYDASLFEGKVACFPFDDHNCPPLQLVAAFCQSSYSWLKADLENVVVVHCKAGKARTGLMISSLLLYLKFFPTAEESIAYYNKKRCVDGKGLILPSQLRYVKYFERVLRNCNGETPMGRKVVLRGFRLHKCPYWIRPSITISDHSGVVFSSKKHPRTKDMMPEDIWFNAPRKGVMVFALPGERGLADLNGDFKVLFHDRHGDFYCWLNTNMMENRTMLGPADLDGFDKRRLPSPGFQVEIVILDYDVSINSKTSRETPASATSPATSETPTVSSEPNVPGNTDANKPDVTEKDDVFSDSENEGSMGKNRVQSSSKNSSSVQVSGEAGRNMDGQTPPTVEQHTKDSSPYEDQGGGSAGKERQSKNWEDQYRQETKEESPSQASRNDSRGPPPADENVKSDISVPPSDFKAIAAASAADASVFTFGDEEDYESEDE